MEKDLKDINSLLKKKGKVTDYIMSPSYKRKLVQVLLAPQNFFKFLEKFLDIYIIFQILTGSEKKELLTSALAKTKASKLTGNLLGTLLEKIWK